MLQAVPPLRPTSTAAEVYGGAFQTTSSIEDTPQAKSSLFDFTKSASDKDDSISSAQLHAAGQNAHQRISMQQTARNIMFYKVAQFLIVMYMVAGAFFPNHHWVEVMMANTHMASQLCVLLSGLLTHHRYRSFFAIASSGSISPAEFVCPAARMSYKIYYRQRIFVFLPFAIAALLWGIPLAIAKNLKWSIRSIISTLTFTSSLQTLWPAANSTPPLSVVPETLPFMLLAQTLIYCWLMYPIVCQSILLARAFIATRTPPNSSAAVTRCLVAASAVVAPILISVVSIQVLPATNALAVQLKDDGIVKDTTSLAGGTAWFVHPLWKFPVFVCGILIAELIYELKWARFSSSKPDRDDSTEHPFFVRWILPFIPDLLIFPTFCLMAYDPHRPDYKTNITARALLWCIGMSDVKIPQWTLQSPWILLPLLSLMLFLFASPYAYRGITWKLICQDPILAVLPGRTVIGLSFLVTLVIFTIPQQWRDEILRGAGLFFILFLWFTPAIVFYYYIYQPWHLWISLSQYHRQPKHMESEIQLIEGQNLHSPLSIKMPLESRDTLADETNMPEMLQGEDTASTTPKAVPFDLKVLTSPHYDPFYPKKPEMELKIYKHIAAIDSPFTTPRTMHLGIWRWLVALFVETQYVQ